MTHLKHLDAFLLSWIERLSRLIQLLTGWDCFLQARFCYVCAAGAQLAYIASLAGIGWLAALFCVPMGILCVWLYFYQAISPWSQILDDWQRDNIHRGLSNTRKVFWNFRLLGLGVALFIVVPPFVPWYSKASLTALNIAAYLEACDPLPPCKGNLRAGIAAFFRVAAHDHP